jgi:hypothetical protein
MDERFICNFFSFTEAVMRWWLLLALVGLAGCSSELSNQKIQANQIPAAVQGAFFSEHPYAQINDPAKVLNQDGSTSYRIPYTRPDGTKGTALYAEMGELQKDN